jgi:mRNA interferase MazF
VIISNDAANKFLNRVQVVPVTSKIEKVFPSEALITVEGKNVKAAADQIMTASKSRLTRKMGTISPEDLHKIETAIRIQLDLH